MAHFDSLFQQLQNRDPLPPLFPVQIWKPELSAQIVQADESALFSMDSSTRSTAWCRAGLLLLNDDLDAAHHIVQDSDDTTSAFWHAIIHRREGDASNSNYWWRKVGDHAAFGDVYEATQHVLQNENSDAAREFSSFLQRRKTWLPVEFVARCEAARNLSSDEAWLRRVQLAEMSALLAWCRVETQGGK